MGLKVPDFARRREVAEGVVARMRERLHEARFEEAFRIGEWLLDAEPDAEVFDALLAPLERRGGQGGLLPAPAMYALLSALRAWTPAPGTGPWRALLEADLLQNLCWTAEAFGAARRLESVPARYAWMRHNRGILLLRQHRAYDGARREFAAVMEAVPVFWKAQACLAETSLAQGRDEEAFALMDALVARLSGPDLAAALGWRGELLLWRGRYEEALVDLAASEKAGAPLAACWTGGALLRLGRREEALAVLDAYLARSPGDLEARTWRGEALRLSGRLPEAVLDLEEVIRIGSGSLWGSANRALVRLASGDEAGARADYLAVERLVRSYFEWKLSVPEGSELEPARMKAVLTALLEEGGGVRRSDGYLIPVWLAWARRAFAGEA